jgi:HEAT repeat protein
MRIRSASFAAVLLATAPVFAQNWPIREPSLEGMTMTEWARALRHHDHEVRVKALFAFQAFASATQTAIPPLIDALDDADENMRNGIASILLSRPDLGKLTTPVAIRLLRDPEEGVRMTAARILWAGDSRALVPVLEALDKGTDRERYYLMNSVRTCGAKLADEDVPKVMARWKTQAKRLDDGPDFDGVLRCLSQVLGESKALALPMARRATRDPNPRVRRAALALCRELSDEKAMRDLDRRALEDVDPIVRCEALRRIGVSETPDLFALAALRDAVHDADERIHDAAAIGLRSYRFTSMAALPDLCALACDPDEEVRFGVVLALQAFPKRAQRRALAPLSHLYFDSDRWVRNSMRNLAFKADERNPAVQGALFEGTYDSDTRNASICVGLLRTSKAADRGALRTALLRMLENRDADCVRVALQGLAKLDPSGAETIPLLVERIRSSGDASLVTGLDHFGAAGESAAAELFDAAAPPLAEAILGEIWTSPALTRAVSCVGLRSNHASVREKSLGLLSTMASRGLQVCDGSVAELLLPGLDDPDPATRRLVLGILKGTTPTPGVMRMILRGFRDDDETVREAALDALGWHHVFPQPVVEAIRDASLLPGSIGAHALNVLAEAGLDDEIARRQIVPRISEGPVDNRELANLVAIAARDGRGIDAIVDRLERETASGLDRDAVQYLIGFVKGVPGTRRTPLPNLVHWACDWDPKMRQAAIDALGRLGPDGADAVPLLKARLVDESAEVADAARKALALIRGSSASPPPHARPCRYSCIW